MSSFDDADRRAKYAVVPKSVNAGKVVKLKPKTLQTEREKRIVLPEERHIENLEKIIQRDYFPELPKLKAQNEYLAAQDRNDVAKMRELQLQFKTQRRTERRTSPGQAKFASSPGSVAPSPAVFDPETPGPSKEKKEDDPEMTPIPGANPEGDNEVVKKKSELDDMSVDTYLSKFTSEDNASFEELSALMAERQRNKIGWLYKAAEEHNRERITRGNAITFNADEQLALRYDKEAIKERPKELDNWNYTAHSHVLFHPEGAPLTEAELEQRAKMYQRVINKSATRFPPNVKIQPSETSMARAAFSQAAQLAGKVDVLGNELGVVKASTLGLVAEPSPAPGVDDTPLMTWGEIDGTPFRLDAADIEPSSSGAPTFKWIIDNVEMPALPARDLLAQRMSDNIAKRYRDRRKHAMHQFENAHKTPRLGSPSSDLAMAKLSPAAKLLMKNKLGIRLGSKTPLLSPSPKASPFSKSPLVPSAYVKRTPKGQSTPQSSITDNLLNISFPSPIQQAPPPPKGATITSAAESKRPTAGDFF